MQRRLSQIVSFLTNRWNKKASPNLFQRPLCHCFDPQYGNNRWPNLKLHTEPQDTSCSAWTHLLELIDEAASDNREEFSPARQMTPEQWAQIVTLPASISKLKSVKHFLLYGSSLVRIPPEIGDMTSLEQFTPYTSYRLHWFPFEITRCKNLRRSTVSTRALYGNFKYRPPFPRLPQLDSSLKPANCSICDSQFGNTPPLQFWVSLNVATDVLPLLIHACSEECLSKIARPPRGYIQQPHQGGFGLSQPPALP